MNISPGVTVREAARFFAGSRLTLARQLAGLRKVELAARIEKTPTAVAAYESGRTRPSPTTVAKLCMALGIEPSFLLPNSGTVHSAEISPHFRSLRVTTQLVRDQAQAYGRVVYEIMEVLERHVVLPERDVPSHPVTSERSAGPIQAARLLREDWGLGSGPISHLLRASELHGVVIVFSPPQTATVDAYSFETISRPIVILNPLKDDYYRQRFDLAHELGHLVMHADVEPGNRAVEEQAHRFAAELLMPADELAKQLPHRANWPLLQELKEYWGVSLQALLYRGRELGVMSGVTYRNAMASMSKEGWRRQEPGARPEVEQPSLLPRALSVLDEVGVDANSLAGEVRVPSKLFEIVTARVPGMSVEGGASDKRKHSKDGSLNVSQGEVVSLFEPEREEPEGRNPFPGVSLV
ncbi:MAG TPA: XRE family transcriptional regulator [Streptosporangiaceae bacterium]|nr:XRE family transcriptional regulator [Streptosporangiaceae bacterium]